MFNFNAAKVKCPKVKARVHVVKALLGARDREGIQGDEIAVLLKAVEYIKTLEAEVARLQSIPVEHQPHVVNVTNVVGSKEAAEELPRGLLGRMFGTMSR